MKKILLGIVIGAFALSAWQRVNHPEPVADLAVESGEVEQPTSLAVEASAPTPSFHCDGRTRCPEMTSCEEAMYFLQNCPGVKMDGGGDGVPCERQWCGNR
jgi:hypothetical protein